MSEKRKNLKTLFSKGGRIWIDGKSSPLTIEPLGSDLLVGAQISGDELYNLRKFLTQRLTARRESGVKSDRFRKFLARSLIARRELENQPKLDFSDIYKELFSADVVSKSARDSDVKSHATLEDLQELEGRIRDLESTLHKASLSVQLGDVNAAVSCLISEMADLDVIEKVSYRHEDKNLDFFLVADQLSSNLLEKISEIEIMLSRKFPNLSIDMEPIPCDEDVPEGSHVVLVRR